MVTHTRDQVVALAVVAAIPLEEAVVSPQEEAAVATEVVSPREEAVVATEVASPQVEAEADFHPESALVDLAVDQASEVCD